MKSAQAVATKYVNRAGAASGDYAEGVRTTTKDQAARAIASAGIYKQAVQEAAARGAYEKGLQRAGSGAWKTGVEKKGQTRYAEGVSASVSKYVERSAEFDGARSAADSLPRGPRGSAQNLTRVQAVVSALRSKKVGGVK